MEGGVNLFLLGLIREAHSGRESGFADATFGTGVGVLIEYGPPASVLADIADGVVNSGRQPVDNLAGRRAEAIARAAIGAHLAVVGHPPGLSMFHDLVERSEFPGLDDELRGVISTPERIMSVYRDYLEARFEGIPNRNTSRHAMKLRMMCGIPHNMDSGRQVAKYLIDLGPYVCEPTRSVAVNCLRIAYSLL